MKFKSYFMLLLVSVIVLACSSQPKIDTSSELLLNNSIEEIKKSLSEDERAEFQLALKAICLNRLEQIQESGEYDGTFEGSVTATRTVLMEELVGKTGTDILHMGREIVSKNPEKYKP